MNRVRLFVAILIIGLIGAILIIYLTNRRPAPLDVASELAGTEGGTPEEPPFDPPPLEALEKVRWIQQPVIDGMELLRERLKQMPPPIPDEEALKLKNTSRENNEKIAAAMGRLPKSPDEVDWDATLVRYLVGKPKTLNFLLQSSLYESSVDVVLYSGPFTIDQDMNARADRDVAVEWATSADGLMNKVVLRDDITWSDGKPFTAQDIEFTFRALQSRKIPCPSAYIHTDQLKGVKAYDDRILVYFHKESLATNIWDINLPILPKHIYERTLAEDPTMVESEEHSRLNRSPITNGPYRFVSWTQGEGGEEIICERRPEWYERDGKRIREKPFIKTIRFRMIPNRDAALLAFMTGRLDEMELTSEQWNSYTGGEDFYKAGTKVAGEEWSSYFIAWNQKPIPDAPFFKDRRVREAMSLSFPHEDYLEKVCFGLNPQARGIFPPGSWMADPTLEPLRQDLRQADRLLAEAGWKDSDGDGVLDKMINGKKVPFRFTIQIPAGTMYEQIAVLLKRELNKLRVVCEINQVSDFATHLTRIREHQFQAASMGWLSGVDPDTARNTWITNEVRNYTRYSNPEVDELFKKGQRELDPEKRAQIYRKIDGIVTRDFPFTFLQVRLSQYAVSRDLRGINFSPRGPFYFSPGIFALWKKKKEN